MNIFDRFARSPPGSLSISFSPARRRSHDRPFSYPLYMAPTIRRPFNVRYGSYHFRPLCYRQLAKEITGSPPASLTVPGWANFTFPLSCLFPYGFMKTPRELGEASSNHRHYRACGNSQGTSKIRRGTVRLHTKIVKITLFTGHMGMISESY